MNPVSNSVLVRLPNEFIRYKVLLKRFWYVDTSMFHVLQWSASAATTTPSLQRIQLWAHLKGVPFDLIYGAGLSHIASQIGEPKETDVWTLNLTSISTAHVKVEVDTSIPLPKIVEVGRMDGSFINVEVEYPWTPPICAHCKEMGHISRNCHLLPVPPITDPTQHPIPPNPKSTTSQKQFCYSCKAPGHLMKNCPKGPKYWVQISRKKKHTCSTVDEPQVGSQQTQSDSLPKEPSDHQPLPDTSISIDPDTATDVLTNDLGTVLPPPVPASMDIDSPPPPLPSVSLDTNLVSSTSSITIPQTEPISPPYLTNCVLGLAAVCPPRPVIPNNHLTTPKISFTSLNPFQLLSPPGNSLQLSPPNSPRTSPITSPKSPAKVPTFEIISASPSLDPSPLLVTPSSPAVLNSDQSANDLHLPHPEAGTPSI